MTNDEEPLSGFLSFVHSFELRHSVFVISLFKTELEKNHTHSSRSPGGVADFKRVPSSSSWSTGLTGIARRISTGFLSCGWTGIAFLISGADSAV